MNTVVKESRLAERRVDKLTSKMLRRALAFQRAFGTATAQKLLCSGGISMADASRLLAVKKERRNSKRRF